MYLKAEDTVSGKEARAQIIIGGKVQELFYAKKVEATIEKNKAEINTIGNRGTGHKTNGWNGTGSMTIYYVTSLFREKIIEYIKTGRDFYFDLVGTNDDPASCVGKQISALYGCNLDSVKLLSIDLDADTLEEDMDFTFEDADILTSFSSPDYIK